MSEPAVTEPSATETSVAQTSVIKQQSAAADHDQSHESKGSALPLKVTELSQRVGVSYQKISARRRRDDFSSWIAEHDPEGFRWTYCKDSNLYNVMAA